MRRIKMLLLLLVLFSSFAHAIKIQVEGEAPDFLERIYQHNNIKNPPKDPRYHWYHGKLETNETRQARWDKERKANPMIKDFTDKMMLESDWEEEKMWIATYEHPFLMGAGIMNGWGYHSLNILGSLFGMVFTKNQSILFYLTILILGVMKIFPKNIWGFLILSFIVSLFMFVDGLLGPMGAILLYIFVIIIRGIVAKIKQ